MFGRSTRSRPVPSKATLRFLYQLAYISSGTAAGIATLCAEERRRQTAIVQKIADNARRIRQSPRYRHQSAALAIDEAESDFQTSDWDAKRLRNAQEHDASNSQLGLDQVLQHRDAHASELPSAVESGYEQLVKKNHRSHRKRRRRETADYTKRASSTKDTNNNAAAHKDTVLGAYRHFGASSTKFPLNEQPKFLFRNLPPNGSLRINKQDLAIDAETFLRHAPWRGIDSTEAVQEESRASSWLLSAALDRGMLDQVRSLFSWKSLHLQLSSRNIWDICDKSEVLLARAVNLEDWLYLYEGVFRHPKFLMQDPGPRTAAILDATVAWFRATDISQASEVAGFGMQHLPMDVLQKHLMQICDSLLEKGESTIIATMLSIVGKCCNVIFPEIIDKMISQSIEDARMSVAVRLLLCKFRASHHGHQSAADKQCHYSFTEDPLALPQLNAVINQCGRLKAYPILGPLLSRVNRWYRGDTSRMNKLDSGARVHLAIAWGHGRFKKQEPFFDQLHASVSPESQRVIDEGYFSIRLRRVWEATHNLNEVLRQYEAAQDKRQGTNNPTALGPGEMALIEICVLAKQPDQALQVLATLQKRGYSSLDSFSLVALALAEKSAWEDLDKILRLAADSKLTVSDPTVSTRLNHVIYLYCKQHTATESWNLVTSMIKGIGFIPDSTTNKTMLRHFVTRKQLGLMHEWSKYLSTIGMTFDMSAPLAASLVSRFWQDQRPEHVLLMKQCHILCSYPGVSFHAAAFKYVMFTAAAYDIREVDTQYKRVILSIAVTNVQRLKAAQGAAPVEPMTKADYDRLTRSNARYGGGSDILDSSHPLPPTEIDGVDASNSYKPFSFDKGNVGAASLQEVIESDAADETDSSNSIPPNEADGVETSHSYKPFAPDKGDFGAASLQEAIESKTVETPNPSAFAPDEGDFGAASLQEATESEFLETPNPSPLAIHNLYYLRRYFAERDELGSDGPISVSSDGSGKKSYASPDSSSQSRRRAKMMVMELSMQRYQKVLDLYEADSPNAMPGSVQALEVAVEARIRLDGGSTSGAKELIERARRTGFDVSRASGSIIIHEIHHSSSRERKDAESLRRRVIDYYREIDASGWDIGHHVGVTAANVLINNERAEYGINLLNDIYRLDLAGQRAPNIVAMTVYLKGYAALKHRPGVRWVVRKVLSRNLRIDRRFLEELKYAKANFSDIRDDKGRQPQQRKEDVDFISALRRWRLQFITRRSEQKRETKEFGNRLIETIRDIVKEQKRLGNAQIEGEMATRRSSLERRRAKAWKAERRRARLKQLERRERKGDRRLPAARKPGGTALLERQKRNMNLRLAVARVLRARVLRVRKPKATKLGEILYSPFSG